MLRIALIDDERLARQGLRQLLEAHPNLQIIGEADSKEAGLELLLHKKPDAVFLDIRMPGATGFDLLREIESPPKVVLVTAHAAHAIQAFDIEAVDYLLKPVGASRFAQAVRRLENACAGPVEDSASQSFSRDDSLCLSTPRRTDVIPLSHISALQADGDFTRFFIKNSRPIMICHPLGYYEKQLPSPPFFRLDRSHIINSSQTIQLDRKSRDEALLMLDGLVEPLVLGRTAQIRLREFLG